MSSSPLPLPSVPRELRSQFRTRIGYHVLYWMVVAGDVPARQVNGRWYIERKDLRRIVDVLKKQDAARQRERDEREARREANRQAWRERNDNDRDDLANLARLPAGTQIVTERLPGGGARTRTVTVERRPIESHLIIEGRE